MKYNRKISGNLVDIRSVKEYDSEFILKLRTDKELSKYINKTENNIQKQKEWIRNQIKTENDYYFIVANKEKKNIGLASIYNIKDGIAEFGRWISEGNQIQNLEMVILLHDFAFFKLDIRELYYVIVKDNKKVISFWKRFGAKYELEYKNENFDIIQYRLKREEYIKIREKQIKLIEKFC